MQLYSPDLESYSNWRNAKGYAAKLLTSCTYGNRTVYADLNVYIHDHDQGIDRSYSISKVALPRFSWKDIKFVFGSTSPFPSNYTVKHIWINIWFKKGDLIEGSVWLDDIEPLIEIVLYKPEAPISLTATAESSSQINLSWQDNSSNESGFKIQRKTGANGNWSTIHTTTANVTSYQNTGLSANTTYSYQVCAYNNFGNSAYSNTATAVTLGESVPDHWNFSGNTSNNATVVLPISAKPNINGIPLLNGDRIGVFTEAGLCCGFDVWNNENLAIIVWGDDDQTQAVDGFKNGQTLHYRIYRPSEQKEWSNVSAGYSQGLGKYSANAFLVLNRLEVLNKKTITLNFSQGWNMFSYNVAVQDARPKAVFGPVVDKVKIVKNGMGDPYIPEHGIDKIEQMSYKEGYLGYFLDETKLEISGQVVDPQTAIELEAGWNMIGFLPDNAIDAKKALESVADHLVIAKDGQGQSYIPEFGINQIGEMKAGSGYLVYLKEKSTLTYPSGSGSNNTVSMAKIIAKNGLLEHFQFSGNTGENATVVVPLDANPHYPDGSPLESGDEIGVFTSQGVCCGASIWEEANTAITVWGDDPQTEAVDGFKAGDTIYYRLWEKSTDKEYWATAVYQNNEPMIYKANGLSALEDLFASITDIGTFSETMPQAFSLQQNYPNPFNPTTKITFSLAGSSDITLTVFNLNGQKVRTLVQQQLPSGHHSIQWDARDDLGTPVSSGTYFYRLTVQQGGKGLINVKKMTLMR